MRNLIENACKYSPDNAPVLVRARIKKDELEVEVLDRGAGIPLGAETAIFDRFRRLDDAGTSPVPGTGLGLYVARRFARDMGGEVSVDGAHEGPWTGARFVLHLPKRDLPAAA
jgi:signal transduction histidine kinase